MGGGGWEVSAGVWTSWAHAVRRVAGLFGCGQLWATLGGWAAGACGWFQRRPKAHMEQCSLTGGSFRCLAMSEFFIVPASSSVLPLSHSVVYEELAMAEPHPNVCGAREYAMRLSKTDPRCGAEGPGLSG